MGRKIPIGIQDFEQIISQNYFYIDKTSFIKEWWEKGDGITFIARPCHFGKTLNISMLEHFFSIEYADKGQLFQGLSIWQEEKYQKLQGTYPVIRLSFAGVERKNYTDSREKFCEILVKLYKKYSFLRNSDVLTDRDRKNFDSISMDMDDCTATSALYYLSNYLYRYYGKKAIILLDAYDVPVQKAYECEYWDDMVYFFRSLLLYTFKDNYMLWDI